MALIVSIIFGFVPMMLFSYLIYCLDRYEKEPVKLLGIAFSWGVLIAGGTAFLVNTLFETGILLLTGSENIASLTTGSLVAPIVEETLKGFAVLLVFLLFRSEFDSILDGIVYSAVVALGFAAIENTYYIYNHGFLQNGWAGLVGLILIRVLLVGWQHPFYTAFIGIGLATARLTQSKTLKWICPLIGWCIAIFMHSIHNTLSSILTGEASLMVTTSYDWLGWLSMLIFITIMIRKERNLISKYLLEEQESGIISQNQFRTACSSWLQGNARIKALLNGQYRNTIRFYQLCSELAHKKNQLFLIGDEQGNSIIIANVIDELSRLSATAVS